MQEFITKKGKKVIIRPPQESDAGNMTGFFNRLIEDDTYILRDRDPVTQEQEENWLKCILEKIKKGNSVFIQAYFKNQLVGQVEISKKEYRKHFVGTLHIGIDRDFRGEGVGEQLIRQAEQEAKKTLDIKIVDLIVFGENKAGLALYKKLGYTEFGRLPESIEYRGGMLDEVHMYKRLG
ncbi:MAG: GNAT family protein [Candidatus Woykebacteria bacterium]